MATKTTKASKNGTAGKDNTRPAVYFHDPDGERQKKLSARVFYNLDASPKAQMDFMTHFMVDKPGGKYLSKEAALGILFEYNVGELKQLFGLLRESLGEATFPND